MHVDVGRDKHPPPPPLSPTASPSPSHPHPHRLTTAVPLHPHPNEHGATAQRDARPSSPPTCLAHASHPPQANSRVVVQRGIYTLPGNGRAVTLTSHPRGVPWAQGIQHGVTAYGRWMAGTEAAAVHETVVVVVAVVGFGCLQKAGCVLWMRCFLAIITFLDYISLPIVRV
jgi:hypothetical protein